MSDSDKEPFEATSEQAGTGRRSRAPRTFPASAFQDALEFAHEVYQFGSGQPVRRLSLFDHLKRSPESGPSRQLITNANKYGLIRGSYKAEQLEITDDAIRALGENVTPRESARAKVKLAIEQIGTFNNIYQKFVGNKLPAKAALIDAAKSAGVDGDAAEEAIDTFIVNLRFVGLLQTLSGADRIIGIDHLLDSTPSGPTTLQTPAPAENHQLITQEHARFETTCFYITPIGTPNSDQRKHSDLFLSSIVEPSLDSFGLKVIRADAIDKPGTITKQVIEYLLRSRLVIADLSYHNPNVFYELAIRHAARLPIVQITRTADYIPFDVQQMRTIVIDNSDIYTFVPKIETYKAEIANQVRRALEFSQDVDNPISIYFPSFKVSI